MSSNAEGISETSQKSLAPRVSPSCVSVGHKSKVKSHIMFGKLVTIPIT